MYVADSFFAALIFWHERRWEMTNESELCISTATEKNVPRAKFIQAKKEKKKDLRGKKKVVVVKFLRINSDIFIAEIWFA